MAVLDPKFRRGSRTANCQRQLLHAADHARVKMISCLRVAF